MSTKCICKLKSGLRKGEKCDAKVKEGKFCGRHQNCADKSPVRPKSPAKPKARQATGRALPASSPKRKSPSPKRKPVPKKRKSPVASPKRKSPSPKRKSPSPKRKSPSPKRKTPSPKRKSPSPKRNEKIFDELVHLVLTHTDMDAKFNKDHFLPKLRKKYAAFDEKEVVPILRKLYEQKKEIVLGDDCRKCEELVSRKD